MGKACAEALHSNPEAHDRAMAKSKATGARMFAEGKHPFQDPEVRKRANRRCLQANSKLVSSRTEGKLAEAFDSLGLEYETQLPVPSHYNASNCRHYYYYVDFAFPRERVVVEADGEPWHSWDEARIVHDNERQKRIEAQGWTVLRYSGRQINSAPDVIAQEVQAILMNHGGQYGREWIRIRSITNHVKLPPSPQFRVVRYNLEVEEDQSYVAKFAVVHNCIALHGQLFPLEEEFSDHWCGRCAPTPETVSMAELGLDIPETRPKIESGEDWFRQQSKAVQRAMMGSGKYDAWTAGQFEFGQLVRESQDPVWGRMYLEETLVGLVGEE